MLNHDREVFLQSNYSFQWMLTHYACSLRLALSYVSCEFSWQSRF